MPAGVMVCKRLQFMAALLAVSMLATCALPAFGVVLETVNDVVVGRNNKGPYMLAWTNANPESVRVVFNGRTLKRGENYNIDYAKGLISFTAIVLNDVIVRVSYTTTPTSQRTAGGMNIPVTLDLFQGKDSSLQVKGLYAADPTKPNAGKMLVGVGGEKKWDKSKVASQFYLSQRSDQDKAGAQQGSAMDRSAFKVLGETGFNTVKLSYSILNSGKDFAGAAETGMGVGKRASDLGVSFDPNKTVSLNVKRQSSEDTAGATTGNKSVVDQQSLIVNATDTTKIGMTHSVSNTQTAAAGSANSVEKSAVQVDQRLIGNTTATYTHENQTVSGQTTDAMQSNQVNVTTAPSKMVSAQVSALQKESKLQGQEQSYNAAVQVKPMDSVAVQASLATKDSTTLGATTKTEVGIQAAPVKGVQFQGHMATNADKNNQQFQRDGSVVINPVDYAKISASVIQKGVNDQDDVTKAAKVELSPFSHTRISAGYQYIETGPRVMTIKDYAATSKPIGFVSLSANMRDRQVQNDVAPDSSNVELALAPVKFASFVGGYQANPEDAAGQVQKYNATSMGVKWKVGSVGVTTDYKSKNEYVAKRQSDEGNIGVDVPFGLCKLTTGVKVARMLDGSATSANTYSLGLERKLDDRFGLSFIGYYTRYLQNRMPMPDKTEYNVHAGLDVKF